MFKHDREGSGQRTQAQGSESVMNMENENPNLKWATGLDNLLENEEKTAAFKEFVQNSGNQDIWDFYFACEGLKKQTPDNAYKLIVLIYSKYFKKRKELFPELSPEIITSIKEHKARKVELNRNIYDPIQKEIKTHLYDLYNTFLGSPEFIKEINESAHPSEFKKPKMLPRYISPIQEESSSKDDYQKDRFSEVAARELLSPRVTLNNPKPVPRVPVHTSYAPNSEANSRVQSDCDPEYLECGGSIYGFPLYQQEKPKTTLPKSKDFINNNASTSSRTSRPLPPIIPSEHTGLMTLPKMNRAPVKTKVDEQNFFAQVANKLKNFELMQQNNHEIYSRPCERSLDSNGNESDQDILDNHIKSWDLESPGISSPVPPIPVRRPINSMDCTNNNIPPPPNRNLNAYATLPRRLPSHTVAAPPILPPKPTTEDKTVVRYKILDESQTLPVKTRLDGKNPCLRQLKDSIIKKGDFRYFCKMEVRGGVDVFQEITEDREELPQFENKVDCQIFETNSNLPTIRGVGMVAEVTYPVNITEMNNKKTIFRFSVLRTPTLLEFKSCLPVIGDYRYFFKTHDPDYGEVNEDCSTDCSEVPIYENNISCQIEKC